jgi:integrase
MPKARGKHPSNALTAATVRNLASPGRYADGNGLYLVVDPNGAKRWTLRTVVHGRRRDIGLGGLALVSLADARDKAITLRGLARSGGDPLALRRSQNRQVPTFARAANQVHEAHEGSWRNAKHRAQWLSTLTRYAVPVIGELRVDRIETPDLLRVLAPIWLTKPETARRVLQRIRTVFDWAKAAGHRASENPALGVSQGLPRQPKRNGHHAALPYEAVPEFVRSLRESPFGASTKLAFEFLVLTASRTSEVTNAEWSEVDLKTAIWTVPGARMKAGKEHRVPLSQRACEILREARKLDPEGSFLFCGQRSGQPLSNMAFLMAIRRLELPVTAHGFRSSFRDWAAERTNFPREVCEQALAHTLASKVEAAYRRSDLFDKRRKLMERWSGFVGKVSADVVPLRA